MGATVVGWKQIVVGFNFDWYCSMHMCESILFNGNFEHFILFIWMVSLFNVCQCMPSCDCRSCVLQTVHVSKFHGSCYYNQMFDKVLPEDWYFDLSEVLYHLFGWSVLIFWLHQNSCPLSFGYDFLTIIGNLTFWNLEMLSYSFKT